MLKLLNILDSVLSIIPMDGDKTVVALAVKSLLPIACTLIPGCQLPALVAAVDSIANVGIALGVAHKAVKAVVRKD